jgi:hypothetical protein
MAREDTEIVVATGKPFVIFRAPFAWKTWLRRRGRQGTGM